MEPADKRFLSERDICTQFNCTLHARLTDAHAVQAHRVSAPVADLVDTLAVC